MKLDEILLRLTSATTMYLHLIKLRRRLDIYLRFFNNWHPDVISSLRHSHRTLIWGQINFCGRALTIWADRQSNEFYPSSDIILILLLLSNRCHRCVNDELISCHLKHHKDYLRCNWQKCPPIDLFSVFENLRNQWRRKLHNI